MSGRGSVSTASAEVVETLTDIGTSIELSTTSTATLVTQPALVSPQANDGDSSSASANQRLPTSTPWSLTRISSWPPLSSVYSTVPRAFRYAARSKKRIYRNLLKILGVFCGIGALTVAWLTLRSPVTPSEVDIQALAAMNRTANGQAALHEVLQANLNKIQEELRNERKQLDVYRKLLEQAKDEVDLHAWTAGRQFIKECIDYQKNHNLTSSRCSKAVKEWDQPPIHPSLTSLLEIVRRQPLKPSYGLTNSQITLTADRQSPHLPSSQLTVGIAHLAPDSTSYEASVPSANAQDRSLYMNLSAGFQHQYIELSLKRWMAGFVTFVATLFLIHYLFRLVKERLEDIMNTHLIFENSKMLSNLSMESETVLIRNTGISGEKPAGSRNRRVGSREYRKGDIWTAAYAEGHMELAKFLVESGAEVKFETHTSGSALQLACKGDQTKLAAYLIAQGASVEALDHENHTPLHHAARVGDSSLAEIALMRGGAVNTADADGCTALSYAASNGHKAITALLLRHDANPSISDKFGAQPLFRAAGLTYVKVVRLLLQAGADIDVNDLYALHGPFHNDNIEITNLLLDAGASIDDRADDGKTALHRAVEVCNFRNVNVLLKRGADINLEDNDQATPLLAAIKGDCKEVTRQGLNRMALYLLQQPGIDVNSRNSAAFQEAVSRGETDIVDEILARGASINCQGWRYGSIAQAAVSSGSTALLRRMLDLGANANISGGEFGTALQAAAFYGNMAMVELLIVRGANVNAKGGRFGSSLSAAGKGQARARVKVEMIALLEWWGAKEGTASSIYEKERWTLTPSGWMWLPDVTF